MDTLSAERRSANMRQIRSKDTAPELLLRQLLHRSGYRFRLHRKDLPGNPDLVFPSRRKIIFVHGCFWHGHHCARGGRKPKTNADYWLPKIARNRERHAVAVKKLKALHWDVLTLWECKLKNVDFLRQHLERFLQRDGDHY